MKISVILDKTKSLSVRSKIITTFLIMSVLVFCALYFFSRNTILDNYLILEKERQERNIKRYENIIQNSLDNLSVKVSDWAFWDDTYYFVKNNNKTYIDSNLSNDSIKNLEINGMFFLNNKGEVVFRKTLDLNTGKETSPEDFNYVINQEKDRFLFKNTEESLSGFVKTDKGNTLFAAKPILKSDGTGPVSGTVIFTKILDESFWSDVEDLVQYPIEVYDYDSEDSVLSDIKNILNTDNKYFIDVSKKSFVYGYFVINDINNEPISILRIVIPNDIYSRGVDSFNSFVGIVFLFVFIVILFIYVSFEFLVFRRIISINKSIQNIDVSGDLTGRIKIDNYDEIGDLILSINNLLDEVSVSRDRENNYIEIEKKSAIELKDKMIELEKLNKLMVGRELKMLELKDEIEKLKERLKSNGIGV